ncbi:sorting nexin-29 isoform X2, partial [Brachionus plicatilis]
MSDSEKKALVNNLSDAIKECQLRFGGKRELATDIDGRVLFLCTKLELIFLHGLKKNQKSSLDSLKNTNLVKSTSNLLSQLLDDSKLKIPQQLRNNIESISANSSEQSFWPVIKKFINKIEIERFELLSNITNDVGRQRAWLRNCLNERCLEKYTISMLGNQSQLKEFYEESSLLLDPNYTSSLPTLLSGLQSILFAINIDNPNLNIPSRTTSPSSPKSSTVEEPELSKKKSLPNINNVNRNINLKKVKKNNVTLDDENDSAESNDEAFKFELNKTKKETSPIREFKVLQNPIKYVKKIEEKENEENDDEEKLSDEVNSSPSEHGSNLNSNVNLIPLNASFIDNISVTSNQSGSMGSSYDNFKIGSSESLSKKVAISESQSQLSLSQTENLSLVELRQLTLSMIQRKDTYETMNKTLNSKLNEEMSRNALLSDQVKNLEKTTQIMKSAYETKTDSLQNENRLLKEQLKKYVSAVQMMNKPELNPIPERNDNLIKDYSHEAEQYEKKLIQVAEMHGELMEFNDRLQKMLNFRNAQVKNLIDELTELRGPLPQEINMDESIDFEQNNVGSNVNLALASVWIPSVFLRSDKSGSHHVYQVYLRVKEEEWNIFRRFSHFYSLHSDLKEKYPAIATISFPKKKTIGNRDNKFVENRRKQLQVYLRKLLDFMSQTDKDFNMKPCRESLIRAVPFFSDQTFFEQNQEQVNETVNSLAHLPRTGSSLLSSSLTNGSPLRTNNLASPNRNDLLYT